MKEIQEQLKQKERTFENLKVMFILSQSYNQYNVHLQNFLPTRYGMVR